MMTKLYPLALLACTIASSAHAAPDQYRAEWGVLADMAGKDFGHGGALLYDYYPLAVRWVVPGKELRITEWVREQAFTHCTFSTSPLGLAVNCTFQDKGDSREDRKSRAELRPDGSVFVKSKFFEKTTYMAASVPGAFERQIGGEILGARERLPELRNVKNPKPWAARVIATLPTTPAIAATRTPPSPAPPATQKHEEAPDLPSM